MIQRIVVHGDSVTTPLMLDGGIEVIVEAGIALTGSGHATIGGKKVCLVEDVTDVRYEYTYTKSGFALAGKGTLKVEAVAADHVHSAKAVMVSGGRVKLFFTTLAEDVATNPSPVEPPADKAPPSGSHEFPLHLFNQFVSTSDE